MEPDIVSQECEVKETFMCFCVLLKKESLSRFISHCLYNFYVDFLYPVNPASDLTYNFGLIVQFYLPDFCLCTSGFPLDKTAVKCSCSIDVDVAFFKIKGK